MKNNIQSSVMSHGGSRTGAGRKADTGQFKESTDVLRVPSSQTPVIKDFLAAYKRKKLSENLDVISDFEFPALNPKLLELPLFSSKVPAGFPSPAEDHVEKRLYTCGSC